MEQSRTEADWDADVRPAPRNGSIRSAQDLTNLPAWAIYNHGAIWPVASELVFIADVFSDAMWALHGFPDISFSDDDESWPYRDRMAGRIAGLINAGSLVLHAQPIAGGDVVTVNELDLTADKAQLAISSGIIKVTRGGKTIDCWAYVGEVEAKLLTQILEWESGSANSEALLSRLTEVVMGKLSAVAGNAPGLPAPGSAARVLSLLMPTLKPTLGRDDRLKLVEAAADWLSDRFQNESGRPLVRKHYRLETVAAFAPYMTGRIFDDVWARAADPARRLPGRRPAVPTT